MAGNMGRPIALGSTIAHAYNKLRSVKVEIPQNNFLHFVGSIFDSEFLVFDSHNRAGAKGLFTSTSPIREGSGLLQCNNVKAQKYRSAASSF